MSRGARLACASALALSLLAPISAQGGKAKENSPKDSLMVVTANLEEAWDVADTQTHGDMDRFVERVLDEYRYKPDILALQEVRRSSATYVAKKLSQKSNQPYQVVVMPPTNPYFPYKGRAGAKETSILINTKTMKVVNNGGYMPTVAKAEHEVEPNDPVFHQAYALLQKRDTKLLFATMSVHLLPRGYLANTDLDKYYRNKWAKQMHNRMRNKFGDKPGINYLMLGDFNQSACLRGHWSDCYRPSPFWKSLKGLGYEDTAKEHGPVDFIFSKGMPGALHGLDSGYKSMPRANRYSDHPFRWSVLGPDRYAPLPPSPMEVDLRKKPGGEPIVQVSWGKGDDRAGSGVANIELTRKLNDGRWTVVKPSNDFSHFDDAMKWKDTVKYRVRTQDRAQNYSSYLRKSVEVLGSNVKRI